MEQEMSSHGEGVRCGAGVTVGCAIGPCRHLLMPGSQYQGLEVGEEGVGHPVELPWRSPVKPTTD
jgi:hypothetical protein